MLRDYQLDLEARVFNAWHQGALNVAMVLATGGGKTVVLADIIQKLDVPTCAIAHRQELVGQLALALNRENVPHGIIAPKTIVNQIIALEMETHGYSRYNFRAPTRVAGVDTLIKRDEKDRWFSQVQLAVIDEGHHVLRNNKWGRAMAMLPSARGLFPTAHALRADGQGLGRDAILADGLVDSLVVGPCGRDLIDRGYLTDWRLVCARPAINFDKVQIGSTGDFNQQQLRAAVHEDGAIVGDVVGTYLREAGGKLGITFAVDIESAMELVKAYRAAGIPAEVITGDTHTSVRGPLMKKFRNRQILQLVSVDVLGEGVDVPAVEVVSMARPTASFQLYAQQFGRALRLLLTEAQHKVWDQLTDAQRIEQIAQSAKPKATILDHVGNCWRFYQEHKFVDSPQRYSLNRREKAARERKGDKVPTRICLGCTLPYEAIFVVCPYCGFTWAPQGRTKPAEVDGDITELDPEVLKQMRGDIAVIDGPPRFPNHVSSEVIGAIRKNHLRRQQHQATLRDAMMIWAGWLRASGISDGEIHRRFYFRFNIDSQTAQTLGTSEAQELEARIRLELSTNNVVAAPPEFNLAS